MNKFKCDWLAPLALSGLLSFSAQAAEPQVHGFISQSLIVSEDNPFYDDEPGTHFQFREIGLNASWRLNDRLRFAGQILSRKAGGLDNGDGRIDFLLADYNAIADDSVTAGIRLGRVKTAYGIYNTVRDIPHGRPGVFVPQSVYFEAFRDALLSVDGGEIYFNADTSIGEISFDLHGGEAKLQNNVIEYLIYQKNITGKFDTAEKYGFKLSYTPSFAPDLTLAISGIDVAIDLEDARQLTSLADFGLAQAALQANYQAFTDYVTSLSIEPTVLTYSAQYNWKDWIFTSEYVDIKTNLRNFSIATAPQEDRTSDSRAFYLQAEWQAAEKLSLYTRYEELYYDLSDKDGIAFSFQTGGNAVAQFNRAYTIGSRWYFTPDWSLTGEYSKNKGAGFINGPDDIDYSSLKKDWDVFILQMSYHFGL